jgi:hypothetical protein
MVLADFQVNGLFPSVVGGTGASAKYFPRNMAYNAGATWVASPLTPSSTSPVGALWVPGDNKLNGQQFNVRATGNFTAGSSASSETVTIQLFAVTGTQASPTYTAMGSTGAFAPPVDGVAHSFALNFSLYGDTGSGIVGGQYVAEVDGLKQNSTPGNATALTGINFGSGNTALYQGAPFGLVVGVTFSISNAANTASLYQLQVTAE